MKTIDEEVTIGASVDNFVAGLMDLGKKHIYDSFAVKAALVSWVLFYFFYRDVVAMPWDTSGPIPPSMIVNDLFRGVGVVAEGVLALAGLTWPFFDLFAENARVGTLPLPRIGWIFTLQPPALAGLAIGYLLAWTAKGLSKLGPWFSADPYEKKT